ncbi:MAG TPA: decaprenyl-phosphate phosphoribosyltransferase [Gemmatimonadaceae bacterium]|nr:decaprenyl-phosphate phosphoribosyltransferase [Gemmatimonadaceae bacterium]
MRTVQRGELTAFAPPESAPVSATGAGAAWLRLLRPRQWVKNAFVLAPLLFSGRAIDLEAPLHAAAAFVLFCLLASGIYCVNDALDADADRVHPVKRHRPVAAGSITRRAALLVGGALALSALLLALPLGLDLAGVLLAYCLLNAAYARWLKRMVLLDVFGLAAFFVLRLLAGSAAVDVHPSVWLLLCGGLLALFLGFAKRRHELLLLGADSRHHRAVLAHYDAPFLDQVSVVLIAVTLVSYIMYTLTSATAAKVGSETLSYSTAFVLYGVLRYLYLSQHRRGGDAAEALLTDRGLLASAVAWLLYCGWAIYRPF